MGNPIKKLAGQTAVYGLSSIVGRFLNYLLTPYWIKVGEFSTDQFGVITEMYAYVAFLVVFLTYGMETTYFRYSSKKGFESKNTYSTILPTIIFYNLSSFHVLSEIQINRNVSMIIEGIDRNYLRYENLDYLKKLIQDIVPFTGRERGYSILLTEVYDIFNLNSGNSKYNSGIITESFLFFGVIGVIFIAFLFSIIIILINFLFSVLKKDLFFIFCYCHLLSQIYWLYRGGMVLFIRKIYFFSTVYLLLFLMFFLGKFLFQKRGS